MQEKRGGTMGRKSRREEGLGGEREQGEDQKDGRLREREAECGVARGRLGGWVGGRDGREGGRRGMGGGGGQDGRGAEEGEERR